MKKTLLVLFALLLFLSVPIAANATTPSTTDQKYDYLKEKSIFTGFSDGSSRLYESMSREQFAVVLFRLMELPQQSGFSSYNDVLSIRWSFHEIEAVKKAGLMFGKANRVFAPEDSVSVEELAVILVRATGYSTNGNGYFSGKVHDWARSAVRTALERGLIPQLQDYTSAATRGMLVEAVYTVFANTHVEPLNVQSVEAVNNRAVKVVLATVPTKPVETSRFSIKHVYGNNVGVERLSVASDGRTLTLWTGKQIAGVVHTLKWDNREWGFVSVADDTTKPTIVAQPIRLPNRSLQITFSEPVESKSATNGDNYSINNGLRLTSLQLSQDQKTVVFTTSDQTQDRDYRLTVRNVKDLAGNTMDSKSDLYFKGSNDYDKPKVTGVEINPSTGRLTVKFSEKIDPGQAAQTGRYAIDKGVYVTQATLDGDGRTVTLRTSAQQDATTYTLTVSGISDLAGNVMDNSSNWKFGGIANPVTPVNLTNLRAIDKNTIEVSFDRAISDSDVKNLRLAVLTDNGSAVNMNGWDYYASRKSDKTVAFQFRTDGSGNPELFRAGRVYVGKVTGISGLETYNGADQTDFAGTVADNRVPYATQVSAVGEKRVKVTFSEPVRNVDENAFRIRLKDGDAIAIDFDELNDKDKAVTEVVLRLEDGLQWGKTYEMTFVQNIVTDAAEFNGLQTTTADGPYKLAFNANW